MKKFAFYCMPHAGILDSWLPVLVKLKSEDPNAKIVFIAPSVRIFEDLAQNRFLMEEGGKVFDGFICQINGGQWIENSIFGDSLKLIKPGYIKKIERVCSFLEKNNFDLCKKIFNYLESFLLIRKRFKIVNIECIASQFSALFYDVVFSIDNFPMCHMSIPRYSLSHGIYINSKPYENEAWNDWSKKFKKSISKNEIIFSTSKNESLILSKFIDDKSIHRVNIPKHDKFWVNYVRRNDMKVEFFDGKKYIILISKTGANERLSIQKKIDFISAIKKVVIDELGLPVLIKLHPTERSHRIYESLFGVNNYNLTWAFMSEHPYQYLDNCSFAISLMSNLCLDLLALKIPIIELSNNQGMTNEMLLEYFGPQANENSRGFFRDNNFVLGADSEAELRFQSLKIIKTRKVVIDNQYKIYKNYFAGKKRNVDYISNKILTTQKIFYKKVYQK